MDVVPDETLFNIFTFLNPKDLGQCAQVSKRWSSVSQDRKLWLKINLCMNSISTEFIENICRRGTKYLGLRSATITQRGNANFSSGNQLKHLDLSRCQNSGNNEEDVLVQITASCQLEKLSLGCLYISNNFVKSIQKSALTLKVLDLSDCRGLTVKSIRRIVSKCQKLTDLNVQRTYLSDDAILSMCRHLPPKLQKLCIANLCIRDEHVRNLVKSCPNLTDLDLSLTDITYMAVPYITETLSNSLVKLSLPRQVDDLQELIHLASMPKLEYLWYNTHDHCRRSEKVKKRTAHLKINEGDLVIGSPNSEEHCFLQKFWENYVSRLNFNPKI